MKLYFKKFTAFYLACFVCWWLQVTYGLSPVLASAMIGFLGSFYPDKGIQAVIYAGSFAGMCSPEHLESPYAMLMVSILGSSLYLISKPHLSGFGGKLGTIAFISSFVLIMTRNLW